MRIKKAGPIAVSALMVVSIVPAKADDPHVETIRGEQDTAMLMDAQMVSTFTGTAATLIYPGTTNFI